MQRLFKTVKGSITVLVTLILVPTIFFTGFMVDLARIKLYGNQAVMTADNYGETVLTQYDNLLKELYGLFAVTQDDKALNNLDKLQGYVSSSFDPAQNNISWEHFEEVQDYLGMNTLDGFMPYQDADITLEKEFIPESHLSNHAVLDTQIGDFMKFRIAQGLLDDGTELIDNISQIQNKENDGKALDKKLELDNEVEELLKIAQKYYLGLKDIKAYPDYIDGINDAYMLCDAGFEEIINSDAYMHYRDYVLADENEINAALEKRSHNEEDEENAVELTEEETALLQIYDNYINDTEARKDKLSDQMDAYILLIEDAKKTVPINVTNYPDKIRDLKEYGDQMNAKKVTIQTLEAELKGILNSQDITDSLKKGIEEQLKKVDELFSQLELYPQIAAYIDENDTAQNRSYDSETDDIIECEKKQKESLLEGKDYEEELASPLDVNKWKKFEDVVEYATLYNSLEKTFEGEGDDSSAKSKKKEAEELTEKQQNELKENEPTTARDIPEEFGYGNRGVGGTFKIKDLISSAADLFKINSFKNAANKLLLKVYTVEYDFGMFSSRTTNVKETEAKAQSLTGYEMNRRLNYLYQAELEYLLGGSNSSSDNLNVARNKILAVRSICNYTSTYSIPEINSAIVSISASAYVINPILGLTVENALRCTVATAETVADWKYLTEGKKVILTKNKIQDMNALSVFEGLLGLDVQTVEQDKGMNYDQYLKIMLIFLTTSDQLTQRTGNLIELNVNAAQIKLKEDDTLTELNFKLDNAYTAVNASCSVKLGFVVMPDQFAKQVIDGGTYQSLTEFEKNGYKFTVTRGY